VLITPNRRLASQVARLVGERAPQEGPARSALRTHGGIIVTRSRDEAMALANAAAAEHLVVDDEAMAAGVRCAGSLFVGGWSAQVAGDYAIGSNHVLPTAGTARVRGGLSAADFVRQITVQRLTRRGLEHIGPSVVALASAEGLMAHAESVSLRLRAPRAGTAASVGRKAARPVRAARARKGSARR
jgi:histidinol dehydrogenase